MRVFIQNDKKGKIANVNFSVAYHGFDKLGWEVVSFVTLEEIINNITEEDILVGFVKESRQIIEKLKGKIIPDLSYPESLKDFLGRKIWMDSYQRIVQEQEFNIFIKPAFENKLFTGRLIKGMKDIIDIGYQKKDIQIWCSEPTKFICEARCFVKYGEIIDVRNYKGTWKAKLDDQIIEQALKQYEDQPNGFAMDFGKTESGKTILVEVNDGYSLGAYGLFPIDYAKLLSARWTQIMETEDYCKF